MIYFSRMEPNCLLVSSRDTHKLAQLKRKNTNTKIPFCWVQNLSTNIFANCKNHLIHKQSQQLATPTTSNERGHCPSWTPPFCSRWPKNVRIRIEVKLQESIFQLLLQFVAKKEVIERKPFKFQIEEAVYGATQGSARNYPQTFEAQCDRMFRVKKSPNSNKK